jgi:hypothetical protein
VSGFLHKVRDFLNRRNKEAEETRDERDALDDELKMLLNEARYHEEPSFEADTVRRRDDLERETRLLFFETKEPQRSMLQGRCQTLLAEIERPDTVKARIGEVKERLDELRQRVADSASSADTDERVAS